MNRNCDSFQLNKVNIKVITLAADLVAEPATSLGVVALMTPTATV